MGIIDINGLETDKSPDPVGVELNPSGVMDYRPSPNRPVQAVTSLDTGGAEWMDQTLAVSQSSC